MVKKLTILSVLEPFLSRPKESLHLSQLSRDLKEPHPTLRQHFNYLEKLGVIKKQIKGRLTLYSLNFSSPCLINYIVIAEEYMLINRMEKDLIFKELVSFLNSYNYKNKYLIFGSFVDNPKNANDVDLLIIGSILKDDLNAFSRKYNLNIHPIQNKSMELISDALKKEIIKKHLIINSTEEFLRWLYDGS